SSFGTSVGAELGPHAPLSQVFTPKRGSTQACRMIHATRTARGMRISITGPLFPSFVMLLFIAGNIPILRSIDRKKSALAEACLAAGHDVRQMRLGDLVVRLPAILLGGQQAAPLH